MASEVYFKVVDRGEAMKGHSEIMSSLFNDAGLNACIDKNDLTAIKMHFGEKGNDTHIPPDLVRPVVEEIKKREGKPFLTDTCVLYRSQRNNAHDHHLLAHNHGFTIENVGAPVVIADGLLGRGEKEVQIPGQIFNEVSLATVALEANAMMVLTHVTGHMATGLGGAIKNMGMGFASRKGKLRQHSVMKPAVSERHCTGCQDCIRWCPENAITMKGDVALIDSKSCIGCGECLAVCRFDAVNYDWRVSNRDLQKRMTEHALGVVIEKREKVGYMNFLISVTKDCDCLNRSQKPLIPDIGILASKDPVAIDAASLDLIRSRTGRDLTEMSYPHIDPWIQVQHGEAIGLGKSEYELIEI